MASVRTARSAHRAAAKLAAGAHSATTVWAIGSPPFIAPHPAGDGLRASLARHPRWLIAAAIVLLLVVDQLTELAGGSTLPGGPLDEVAHLLTTVIVLCALRVPLSSRFARAAMAASLLIDLDHIPGRLGDQFLTAGTPRPYTHSLLTVLILLVLALGPRWRPVFLGAAFGLVVHLWRDLSESGSSVSLLWPITDHPTHASHTGYLLTMLVLGAVALVRAGGTTHARRMARGRLSPPVPEPPRAGPH